MTVIGQAEGIDHGTPRGARQHARRHVPTCEPCLQAIRAENRTQFTAGAAPREDRTDAQARFLGGKFQTREQSVRRLTETETRKAQLVVADRATSADECRELLALLGLLPKR